MRDKKEYDRQWYQNNKEHHLSKTNDWKKQHPNQNIGYAKRQYFKNRADWAKVFDRLFQERGFNGCFICGKNPIQAHHINPDCKDFKISEIRKVKCTEERIEKPKTDLIICFPLCISCHSLIHAEMKKSQGTASAKVGE